MSYRAVKKLIKLLFFGLLILLLLRLALNTFTYHSQQNIVQPIAAIAINDDVAERLSAAIQIPTVSYPNSIDTLAFDSLLNFIQLNYPLADSLLDKETINDYSLLYHWPGRNHRLNPILLLAHTDVVPVETESQKKWTEGPYSGKIKNGYIWGRGALDDKVSVLGILESVEMLLRVNYQPERGIYLAFGHDEEVSGINGAKAIASELKKRGVSAEYVLDEGGIILEKALPGLAKPLAMIGNTEKGYTTLTLTVRLSQGGHSSMPPSETAVGLLSQAIIRLQDNPFPGKIEGPVKTLFDHAGPEMNYPLKIVFANLWLFNGLLIDQLEKIPTSNAMIRTTMAPTILAAGLKENVLPTEAMAKINFRIYPNETPATVLEYVQQTIADDRITVTEDHPETSQPPSAVSDTKGFGYNIIQRTVGEIFPETVITPSLVIAATDSRHYHEVAKNTYRFLPIQLTNEDLKRIHGIDERISTEQYKILIRFYYQLIVNSCR